MIFELIVDEYVKVWKRFKVLIDGDTLEEVINYISKYGVEENNTTEYLYETEEIINSECPEIEIMDKNGNLLKSINDTRSI